MIHRDPLGYPPTHRRPVHLHPFGADRIQHGNRVCGEVARAVTVGVRPIAFAGPPPVQGDGPIPTLEVATDRVPPVMVVRLPGQQQQRRRTAPGHVVADPGAVGGSCCIHGDTVRQRRDNPLSRRRTACTLVAMSAEHFEPVHPDDHDAVAAAAALTDAARMVDDPDCPPQPAELLAGGLRYGWDLEPSKGLLYRPDPVGAPVGWLTISTPERDNRQLVTADITVHPAHRRRGHGTAMAAELLRQAHTFGRSIIWLGCAHDDDGAATFLRGQGFSYASHDARRYQRPDQLDHDHLDRLYRTARQAAADYDVVRTAAPTPEDLLGELVEVTAAINDAPMGDLEFENEAFDLQRLKDFETASRGKGERLYRVYARHRATGAVGGHTIMMVQPAQPTYGNQLDTAVHRDHRGHRLGMLLKIEMMRWLAETEPQIERIETWNHADNAYMINVNEQLGYRLSRVFDDYQLKLV